DQLVGGLDGLPGARGAHVHDRGADRVEDRAGLGEVCRVPTDHDGQGTVDRARFTTGDRGVQHAQAVVLGLGCEVLGDVRADGGEVDDQRAGLGVGEHAVLPLQHGGHVRGVRHHGDDHVRPGHRLGDRVGGAAAGLDQCVVARGAVVAGDGEAHLDEVDGHRGTHDAQSDEGDVGHDEFLVRVGRSVGAAGGGGQPGERVGLGGGAGGLVLQPEPAVVAAGEEVGGPAGDRRLAGAGLVPAGGVGDLHVRDTVGIGGARRVDVVAVGDQVVHVEEQADVFFSGTVD